VLEPTVAMGSGREAAASRGAWSTGQAHGDGDASEHDQAGGDGDATGRDQARGDGSARPRDGAHDDPDAEWAVRAARGEPGAFGRIYERHVDAVYRYVHFRVRDAALAQDLTHDVFVRALDGVRGLREPGRVAGWLLRIAHNQVANHWRWRDARPEDRARDRESDLAGARAAPGPGRAFDGAEARVDAERALAAATALTDLQREVVALRFVAGLSLEETATAMGRSVNAVKNLQHHALRGLRDRLAGGVGEGGEEDDHERGSH